MISYIRGELVALEEDKAIVVRTGDGTASAGWE